MECGGFRVDTRFRYGAKRRGVFIIVRSKSFFCDERGEVSVKGLAITVGAIVVIGAVVTWLSGGQLTTWISDIWDSVWNWIQNTFMT